MTARRPGDGEMPGVSVGIRRRPALEISLKGSKDKVMGGCIVMNTSFGVHDAILRDRKPWKWSKLRRASAHDGMQYSLSEYGSLLDIKPCGLS